MIPSRERDYGKLTPGVTALSWRTALRDFVAFDVRVNDERERRIVSAALSEGHEALYVSPGFVHIGAVGFYGVS